MGGDGSIALRNAQEKATPLRRRSREQHSLLTLFNVEYCSTYSRKGSGLGVGSNASKQDPSLFGVSISTSSVCKGSGFGVGSNTSKQDPSLFGVSISIIRAQIL